jgi:hypothetical protein
MSVVQEESARDLQLGLRRMFKDLLKPVKVKSLVITKADRYTVRGIVLTVCPIEKREFGKDFEVGLGGDKGNSIRYVIVDGRRLLPRATKTRHRDEVPPLRLLTA